VVNVPVSAVRSLAYVLGRVQVDERGFLTDWPGSLPSFKPGDPGYEPADPREVPMWAQVRTMIHPCYSPRGD